MQESTVYRSILAEGRDQGDVMLGKRGFGHKTQSTTQH